MRFFLGFTTAVVIIFFSTDSFSFNPSLVNTLLIQACGTTTAPAPAPPPSKAAPPRRRLTSQITGRGHRRGRSRSNIKTGSSGGIYSSTIRKGKSSRLHFRNRNTDDELEDLLDGGNKSVEMISAKVIDAWGKSLDVDNVTSGVDNQVRIETGNGKAYLNLASIKSIRFGKRKLNMINAKLTLKNGQVVNGRIFHKSIFEFTTGGNVTVARVDELSYMILSGK